MYSWNSVLPHKPAPDLADLSDLMRRIEVKIALAADNGACWVALCRLIYGLKRGVYQPRRYVVSAWLRGDHGQVVVDEADVGV